MVDVYSKPEPHRSAGAFLEGVKNHGGDPLSPTMFPVVPPPEIGKLISANLEEGTDAKPMTDPDLDLRGFGYVGSGIFVFLGALLLIFGNSKGAPMLGLGIFGFLCLVLTKQKEIRGRTCTFVGLEGIARFFVPLLPDGGERKELLLFRDAKDLRTNDVQHFENLSYRGTSFRHEWKDAAGTTCFLIEGIFGQPQMPPKSSDPYLFAISSEAAWTLFKISRVKDDLNNNGFVQFDIEGGNWIRLGVDEVELSSRNNPVRVKPNEIGVFQIRDGIVTIKARESRIADLGDRAASFLWSFFGNKSISVKERLPFGYEVRFSFRYSELANARAFLHLFEQLTGIKPTG